MISWVPDQHGAVFRASPADGTDTAPVLPIRQDPEAASPALRLLEALWLEERVEEVEEPDRGYLIPTREIYALDAPCRVELGLPPDPVEVEVQLHTSGYASPTGDFGVRADTYVSGLGRLVPDARTGPFMRLDDEWHLVPRATAELYSLVDRFAALESPPLQDQLVFIGQLREAAAPAGAALDRYLASQDIIVPEALGVDVNGVSPEELQLSPIPLAPGQDASEFELGYGPTKATYFRQRGTRRRRLVLDRRQRDDADRIKERSTIRGTDVPRFLENPEAFLPDSIDAGQFSLRVRGLIPQRYQAQPSFTFSEGKSRGWFDVDLGVDLMPESLPDWMSVGLGVLADHTYLGSLDDFAKLCEAVDASGDPWVLDDGEWIEIGLQQAARFLEAWEHMRPNDHGGYEIRRRHALILDVISNLDELEYKGRPSEFEFIEDLPEYAVPVSFNGVMRPYQRIGYHWLRFLHENGFGGLLADDMGLGKTIQIIALMSSLAERGELGPCLLVLPVGLVQNWQEELARFCPSIQDIHQHHGPDRESDPTRLARHQVVITTYGTLRRDQVMLAQIDWTFVACDEAQKVKNPGAQTTAAVKGMKGELRLALTGTPVENSLRELWCIVDFAQPGQLGSRSDFKKEFEDPIRSSEGSSERRREFATRLQERLTPHYLRRTKQDVLDNLPPKYVLRSTDSLPSISLGERQRQLYAEILHYLREGALWPLPALTRLIQVCSHPDLYRPGETTTWKRIEDAPKLAATLDIIRDVRDEHEKVLVFTRFLMMQRILQDVVADCFGVHAPIINGEVAGPRRQEVVKRFNTTPGFGVMILSPEAAGVGLNITGANHVIHYTRLWNPAKEDQATDRVYRIGQEKPVTVYYPIVVAPEGRTVEEHLDELLREKQALARDVVWPRESLSVQNDLEKLLKQDTVIWQPLNGG